MDTSFSGACKRRGKIVLPKILPSFNWKKKKDKEMTVLTQAVRNLLEQREGLTWNWTEEIETWRMSFDYSNPSAKEKIV